MDDEDFQNFIDAAQDELERKQETLTSTYGLGSFSRWLFDQSTQKLQFFDEADNLAVDADVIDIGSFAFESNSWKWAWANDSIIPSLRQRADPLQALTEITGIDLFSQENAFEIEGEAMAWELAAISVKQLNALGCYRAPSSSRPLQSFLAIMEIHRVAA